MKPIDTHIMLATPTTSTIDLVSQGPSSPPNVPPAPM